MIPVSRIRTCAATLLFLIAVLLSACGIVSPSGKEEESPAFRTTFFALGKADAILLQTADAAVLIDTGEKSTSKALVQALGELGVTELDCLILTHFDKDHVGGAARVLESIPVCQVLQTNYIKAGEEVDAYFAALAKAGQDAETVREAFSFSLDGVQFIVDPPEEEEYADDPSNNASLIVTAEYGKCRLLFLGDAEKDRLNEWLSQERGQYDFVKMPHHGSWHKPLKTLMEVTQPSYAVITSSDTEPEDEKTTELLNTWHVETYNTRFSSVWLTCDGNKITMGYY